MLTLWNQFEPVMGMMNLSIRKTDASTFMGKIQELALAAKAKCIMRND